MCKEERKLSIPIHESYMAIHSWPTVLRKLKWAAAG